MLAAKFFSSSNNEDQETPWSQNPWRKNAIASRENMMNWGKMSPVTICMHNHFASLETTLKTLHIKQAWAELENSAEKQSTRASIDRV